MKHTEEEIVRIKELIAEMWQCVESQILRAQEALLRRDTEAAREVLSREKRVNAYELSVDRACENFIALFNPVAVDLRFVLSLMKINNNLERMGDFAEGIARFVTLDQTGPLPEDLAKDLRLREMCDEVNRMIELSRTALAREDTRLAAQVFARDSRVDRIHGDAVRVLAGHIVKDPARAEELLRLYTCIRRLERIGDRCSNIAEDIVFYVDAKEMRHLGKQNGKEEGPVR